MPFLLSACVCVPLHAFVLCFFVDTVYVIYNPIRYSMWWIWCTASVKAMSWCLNSVSKCTARLHDPLHISYILSVLTRSYRDLVFLKMRMRNQVDRVSHIKELAGSNFCSRPRLTASARIVCRLLMMWILKGCMSLCLHQSSHLFFLPPSVTFSRNHSQVSAALGSDIAGTQAVTVSHLIWRAYLSLRAHVWLCNYCNRIV